MAVINKNTASLSDQQYIKRLIAEGEHQKLDFKFAISDSRKIARTLVAFANTDGGRLLIGVKDNGAIAGVRSDEEYYMVEAAANMYCKPTIPFNVRKWALDGKTILEIIVEQQEMPNMAQTDEGKWMAYVRVNDENFLANRVLVESWKRKKKPSGIFMEYTKHENILLSYLTENENITVSKFCRIAKLTKFEAENILINLLSLNIIQIHINEKGATYSLQ